ncbi:MAG TPA: SCO family protein [Acidimicrobiales bacterium]
MSTGVTEQGPLPSPLSEAERAAAFQTAEPKVPRKFALIAVCALAVLVVGGAVGERLLSAVGLNPDGATTPASSSPTVSPPPIAPPAALPSTPEVGASLSDFMGLTSLPARSAPAISMVDQTGRLVSLADERGAVVVLTFFDAPCQDICPILSTELVQAAADLGPKASHVVFLTVNTDPLALSTAPAVTAAARDGLGAVTTWHFLTSNLDTLNGVWRAYGVSVNVSQTSHLVAHNDVLYFIDPAGHLRFEATPFADESPTGAFSLAPATIARWGQGIATEAGRLLGGTP